MAQIRGRLPATIKYFNSPSTVQLKFINNPKFAAGLLQNHRLKNLGLIPKKATHLFLKMVASACM